MSFLKDNLGKILGIIGIGAGVGAIAKISYNKGRKDFAKQTDEKFTEKFFLLYTTDAYADGRKRNFTRFKFVYTKFRRC